jgi:hypothetical protein
VFVGKQVDMPMVVIKERQGSEGTIRLKCPKRIINTLGIPEKGYLTVHIKGYHRERVRYGVTVSSMRINLGAGFKDLFTDEGNRITATFKLYNDKFELFYKEDEKSLYPVCKRSAKYIVGIWLLLVNANTSTQPRRINIDAPTTIYL